MDQSELQQQMKMQQYVLHVEQQAKLFLDSHALLRFYNIKLVQPEKAHQIATLLLQGVQSGRIHDKLTDEEFKQLLLPLQEKKEFHVTRK